jgi:hypothetical protein
VVASKSGSKEETTEVDVVSTVEPVPVETVTPPPVSTTTTTETLGTTAGLGTVGGPDPVEATAPTATPALDDVSDGREFGSGALVDDRDLQDDDRDRL